MDILCTVNPENATEEEVASWRIREAARAVVTDDAGRVALLYVAHKNYYKLPGGGLEGEEDHELALMRECEEEIGCRVHVLSELGAVVELRKLFSLKQISYCYVARVDGEKGTPSFTDEERLHGFALEWHTPEEALRRIRESEALDAEGRAYIVPRDTVILEAALKTGLV